MEKSTPSYDAPSDIPDDYYSDLLNYTGSKAVIYSEIGWIATNAVSPYNGSEALQAAFVDRFFTLNQNVDIGYAVWLFCTISPITLVSRHSPTSP